MIKGVGTDIIEISRIEKLLSQHSEKGLLRIFTDKEISYCSKKRKNAESFAGRFAAKEALFKATGIGWRDGLKWIEGKRIKVEIKNGTSETRLQK